MIKKLPTLPRLKKQAGNSLTEMIVVLSIFGLIVGALWAIAGTVTKQARHEQFFQQVLFIVKNVRSNYMGRMGITGAEGVLTPQLAELDLFPREMVTGTTLATYKVNHPWKSLPAGTVFVAQDDVAKLNDQKFRLIVKELEKDVCIKVLLRITSAGPNGLVSVLANNVAKTLPISVTTAQASCNSATSNTLIFVYRLRPPQE